MNFKDNFTLAQELKAGNEKAFNFLMNTYCLKLYSYAFSLVDDHFVAEDLVQNVLIRIWVKRKNINPSLLISSYLYKAVYNEFINLYKKNKPVIYVEKKYLEALEWATEDTETNFEELLNVVNLEIEKLTPKCKEVFLLNKKNGLTNIEIAEYLNISIKTVEGHMTRAFKTLNKKLVGKIDFILFLLFEYKRV